MKKLESQLNTEEAKQLYSVIASITDEKEIKAFLRDLMTLEEMEEIVRRFRVVRLLNENVSYRNIAEETGVSTTTVTRINYWLHHGTGGYGLALKKL